MYPLALGYATGDKRPNLFAPRKVRRQVQFCRSSLLENGLNEERCAQRELGQVPAFATRARLVRTTSFPGFSSRALCQCLRAPFESPSSYDNSPSFR